MPIEDAVNLKFDTFIIGLLFTFSQKDMFLRLLFLSLADDILILAFSILYFVFRLVHLVNVVIMMEYIMSVFNGSFCNFLKSYDEIGQNIGV